MVIMEIMILIAMTTTIAISEINNYGFCVLPNNNPFSSSTNFTLK